MITWATEDTLYLNTVNSEINIPLQKCNIIQKHIFPQKPILLQYYSA